MLRLPRFALAAVVVFGAAGCPRPVRPVALTSTPRWTVADAGPIDGLAIEGDVAVVTGGRTVSGFRAGVRAWQRELPAAVGPVAIRGQGLAVAVSGTGPLDGLPLGLRGDPGAAVVGLDAIAGGPRWVLGVGATEWSVVRSIAPYRDGFVIAGSFAGTLRVGDRVVTSAGSSDGFWAELGSDGSLRALHRMGGAGADAIAAAIATDDDGLALAGTYAGDAELAEVALAPVYGDGTTSDGFVARFAADGALAWTRTWGGPAIDACAGLTLTDGGGLAVAGTVRGLVDVAGRRLDVAGNADAMIAFFDRAGAIRGAFTVGGGDYDGVTAIVGHGDRVAIAGWYSGAMTGPRGPIAASGADDGFVAIASPQGLLALWPISSASAASVRALAADATGFGIAIDHDGAATLQGDALAAGAVIRAFSW